MRSWKLVLLVVASSLFTPSLRADDAVADKQARQVAYDVVVRGTELFNTEKNANGCYHLYEGALISLKPMLAHRPAVVKAIDEKLAKAKGQTGYDAKAFTLREALDEVLKEGPAKKPLWERLGGEMAVRAVVKDLIAAAAPDPKVNFFRDGKFPLDAAGAKKLEQYLVEMVSSATGGPLKYTGRDMKTAHAGMKITDAEFDALAGHLITVLKKYNVPKAELDELVGIVASTRKDIVEVTKKPLWDRLGGEDAVRAVTREFLETAAKDPKANIDRKGDYPLTAERAKRIEQQVVEFISSVTGGPLKYTGRDMKNSHQGMKITEDEFNVAAGHLVAALKKFKVPQAEIDELVGLVGSVAKDIIEVKK